MSAIILMQDARICGEMLPTLSQPNSGNTFDEQQAYLDDCYRASPMAQAVLWSHWYSSHADQVS